MYRIFKADKDTYITNRVINSVRSYNTNVGLAGTIDLFKLYGATTSGSVSNIELTRGLIHFDISELRSMVTAGTVNPSHTSFFAKIKLFDVYGGQPTPSNFVLNVNPLSRSFDEGRGKDVVFYGDYDAANFLTASLATGSWVFSGCGASGSPGDVCDFFTGSYAASQTFVSEEHLSVDVTATIRAVLSGTIPDEGFRIAYTAAEETNTYTYFVKRFASRHAYDVSKRPRLIIGYDDSFNDSSSGMRLDTTETLFLFNYDHGSPANLISGSSYVTGSNSLACRLLLPISGGFAQYVATGSQHYVGGIASTGVYSASFTLLSTNQYIAAALATTGSVIKLTPVWASLDGTVLFHSGSKISVTKANRTETFLPTNTPVVTVSNLKDTYDNTETPVVRVNVFDRNSPLITAARVPLESPNGLLGIASEAHWSVRNISTGEVVVPFDTTYGSTRLSSDSKGLFFKLFTSDFPTEQTYVIDVLLLVGGNRQVHSNASSQFKIVEAQLGSTCPTHTFHRS